VPDTQNIETDEEHLSIYMYTTSMHKNKQMGMDIFKTLIRHGIVSFRL